VSAGSIVCGVDDSRHARFALDVAGRYARRLDLRLIVLHVPPRIVQAATGLALVERMLREEGVAEAQARVSRGDPAECLADLADEERAELIVVGSRGLVAFRTAFLGSVSNALVGIARCPVLVVPRSATADAT
jgi:nucleotide-binding universal stress UspA family protein